MTVNPAGNLDVPAHIHPGTCDNLTPQPKYPLENVKDGVSKTVVPAPMDELFAGHLAVNIHKSNDDLKTYGVRRHPLARSLRLVDGILVASFLAAGAAACLPASSTSFGVTIATAPAETLAFSPSELTVQAPGPIKITFQNGSSVAHNLVFGGGLTGASRTIVEPGTSDEILLEPTAAGTYSFACTIHDGMAGVLIVMK